MTGCSFHESGFSGDRIDCVHGNVMTRDFECQPFGHGQHRTFGGIVWCHARARGDGAYGSNIDDGSTTLFDHRRNGMFASQKHAARIHRKHRIEFCD